MEANISVGHCFQKHNFEAVLPLYLRDANHCKRNGHQWALSFKVPGSSLVDLL